ncbi:HEAT repeat domain-containing protein [Gordonia soli]|uniref:HEAT repeat-containing protein n=1 Tax=Gordonia soli NBRC 108243 TaxID=1223545 RepID=M0QNN5_9ACTN|nr:HEAT repeat domain-containing protein [Gordonia soli]GAC69861.1 hypothetical protein GS4_28_01090 [Gordonia soli NBRC 108243]
MTATDRDQATARRGRMLDALSGPDSSIRLQAALAMGTDPDVRFVEPLVARCAVEPDFFVRDMLTWALTRHPVEVAVPLVVAELDSSRTQACSQALHTLSKIGDRSVWPSITAALLHDRDDEIARSAWRAAAVLVPDGDEPALAAELVGELGRGDKDLRRSLSRALVTLGDEAVTPVLTVPRRAADPQVRAHAMATVELLHDPDIDLAGAIDDALRITLTQE